MGSRKLEPVAAHKRALAQRAEQRRDEAIVQSQVVDRTPRAADADGSPRTHAQLLNQLATEQPTRLGAAARHVQRTYGNRSVTQGVALARPRTASHDADAIQGLQEDQDQKAPAEASDAGLSRSTVGADDETIRAQLLAPHAPAELFKQADASALARQTRGLPAAPTPEPEDAFTNDIVNGRQALRLVLYDSEAYEADFFKFQARMIAESLSAIRVPASCPKNRSKLKLQVGGTAFTDDMLPLLARAKACTGRHIDEIHIVGHLHTGVRFSHAARYAQHVAPGVRVIFHGCSVATYRAGLRQLLNAFGSEAEIFAHKISGEAGRPYEFWKITLPEGESTIKTEMLKQVTIVLPDSYIRRWVAMQSSKRLYALLQSKETEEQDDAKAVIIDELKQRLKSSAETWSTQKIKQTLKGRIYEWERPILEEELTRRSAAGASPAQRAADDPGSTSAGESEHVTGDVAPAIEAAIQRVRGQGQSLDPMTRTRMDTAFGADFGAVRVHTDAHADALNRTLQARAFTTGHDIFFRSGEYNPATSSGRELLAHELTHVVQQSGDVRLKLTVSTPDDEYEQEAERVGRAVAQQEAAGTAVRRQAEEDAAFRVARQPSSLSHTLNVTALSDEELHQEIDLIRQRLRENPVPGLENDQMMSSLQALENEVWRRQKAQAAGKASAHKESRPSSSGGYRSRDTTKLSDVELEQEYYLVQQRLLSSAKYTERKADEAYLQTIEREIEKRNEARPKEPEMQPIVALSYDEFSLPDGRMKSTESASALIHSWEKLEQVYLDAGRGNARAKQFVQDLEETFAAAGKNVAGHMYSLQCSLPVSRELSGTCTPNWSYLDFLRRDKPGAIRLRQVIAAAYEQRAKELGIRNDLIISAINLLLAGVVVKSALGAGVRAEAKEASAAAGESKEAIKGGAESTAEGKGVQAPEVSKPAKPGAGQSGKLPATVGESMTAEQAQTLQKAREFYAGHDGAVGALMTEGESPMLIKSGEHGGPWGGTHRGGIPRGKGYGFTQGGSSQGNIATHVEGHAAAIMWQRGIKRAILIVDRAMCEICSRDLPGALPPRSELIVISPGEGVTIVRSTHAY